MKIRIEIDENLEEQEVIIRAPAWNEEVTALKERIAGEYKMPSVLNVRQKERDFFIPFHDILFFETENKVIYAHTNDKMLETEYKLYELEERLPGYFMRISKSAILNTKQIYSINRNLAASSIVTFTGTHKRVFVSRYYYKPLTSKLEEQRLH